MYSVVVPLYNEAGSIAELHQRLNAVMSRLNEPFEIIYIDDGSSDATPTLLKQLRPAVVITLRTNFGQTAALAAGFKTASGDWIITLDGDLQNPPEEIPKLMDYCQRQQLDMVSGWRQDRHDSFFKRKISRGANALRRLFINDGIHDSGCTLKVYRRDCVEQLDLFGEIHRFIPGLLRWQGYKIGELPVRHERRRSDRTKYGSERIVRGLVDMIGVWFWRKYSSRPLHLFGGSGLLLTGLGMIMLGWLALARYLWNYPLATSIWPLMAVLFILVGIQLFITGLIAEILIKNYWRDRTPYSIKAVVKQ